eukprot:198385-Hanusia_phi.AAC.1
MKVTRHTFKSSKSHPSASGGRKHPSWGRSTRLIGRLRYPTPSTYDRSVKDGLHLPSLPGGNVVLLHSYDQCWRNQMIDSFLHWGDDVMGR